VGKSNVNAISFYNAATDDRARGKKVFKIDYISRALWAELYQHFFISASRGTSIKMFYFTLVRSHAFVCNKEVNIFIV
jgi:hypothetical protein